MRTLVVGAGALGGLVAARLHASGRRVSIGTKDAESASRLRASGLRVSGVGGEALIGSPDVAPLDAWRGAGAFDLVLLATKAHDAIRVAPVLTGLLAPGGFLLPIQNGDVARMIADQVGEGLVLGGLSNLGATMTAPGSYEQRNAGHLLVGELAGGESVRAERMRDWFGTAVEVRVTQDIRGAVWAKLLLNCSVTTIGAMAARTMREYIGLPEGRALFDRAYAEALAVALASGIRPARMIVDAVPPGWAGRIVPGDAHEAWLREVVQAYGDVKPSMLQDFERHRTTEIDFINGHVVDLGRTVGVVTPANAAIVDTVQAISRGDIAPGPEVLARVLARVGRLPPL
jgi:2-dehydropantoate 2-reductase